MKDIKLIVCLVGIFLLGGIAGGLVGMRFARPPSLRLAMPEQWGPMQLQRFAKELDLSQDQIEKVRPIIKQSMIEVGKLQQQSRTQTAQMIEKLHEKLLPLLTPEQRQKLEEMRKVREERFQRFLKERRQRMDGLRPPGEGPRGFGPDGPGPGEPHDGPPPANLN